MNVSNTPFLVFLLFLIQARLAGVRDRISAWTRNGSARAVDAANVAGHTFKLAHNVGHVSLRFCKFFTFPIQFQVTSLISIIAFIDKTTA